MNSRLRKRDVGLRADGARNRRAMCLGDGFPRRAWLADASG
jgi:hypothetical protein